MVHLSFLILSSIGHHDQIVVFVLLKVRDAPSTFFFAPTEEPLGYQVESVVPGEQVFLHGYRKVMV